MTSLLAPLTWWLFDAYARVVTTDRKRIKQITLTRGGQHGNDSWAVAFNVDDDVTAIPIVFWSLMGALSAIAGTVAGMPPSPIVAVNGLRLDGAMVSALDFAITCAIENVSNGGTTDMPTHVKALCSDLSRIRELMRGPPPRDN